MGTTLSMWLGITFTVLAIAATILQAWLWSFPMVPDPGGPDPNGKSTAPKSWTLVHRFMGVAYVLIYVVLMVEMVPRLWEYQVELPARTVVHACMGIVIGVLLLTKISIIRWFQHFGKALPSIGLALLSCTLILATLSIPFAVQAHDFGDALEPGNVARVRGVLQDVEWEEEVDLDRLLTQESFEKGVDTLTGKCTKCHDIRTILNKPRTAQSWYNVVVRMVKKPMIGEPIHAHEVPAVTAYLVAITPEIQRSLSLKKQEARAKAKSAEAVKKVDKSATLATSAERVEEVEKSAEVPPITEAQGQELLANKCSDCHEVSEIDNHGKDDRDGWKKVVEEMVEEGCELTEEEANNIITYLSTSAKYAK